MGTLSWVFIRNWHCWSCGFRLSDSCFLPSRMFLNDCAAPEPLTILYTASGMLVIASDSTLAASTAHAGSRYLAEKSSIFSVSSWLEKEKSTCFWLEIVSVVFVSTLFWIASVGPLLTVYCTGRRIRSDVPILAPATAKLSSYCRRVFDRAR